jgi:two-component system chemotaxis response regulator CheB
MIRCLIADDSPTFRQLLRQALSAHPDIEVVGEAQDGQQAVTLTQQLRPDVVTMDVYMPRQSGLEAIRDIMSRVPTPIVVISSASREEVVRVSFQALALGALEVLSKPDSTDAQSFGSQAERIRRAVCAIAGIKRAPRVFPQPAAPAPPSALATRPACIGVVTSTGGPAALQQLLSALPADFPVPLLVVQHIAEGFTPGMVRWLAEHAALRVKLAEHGERLVPGTVLFAPDRRHLLVSLGRVRLDDGPPVRGFKPAGTALLASLAREYGPAAAGLILTGMGDDGVAGLKLMRERGGFTLAQGAASSAIYGMPRVALESGAAALSLELAEIPGMLLHLVGQPRPSSARKRLLLVDDTETVLLLEKHVLSGEYELSVARNGQEAVEAAQRLVPDGILMDYSMPVMTGGEALRQLRSLPTTRTIPIIMVTSESEPALLQRCRDDGCQAIVKKPIEPRVLAETVHRFVPA